MSPLISPVVTYVIIAIVILAAAVAFPYVRRAQLAQEASLAPKPNSAEVNVAQLRAVVSLLIFGGLIWYFFFGGLEKQTAVKLQEIHTQVATDFAAQYAIAKRNGSAMDACVAAGLAAAGALQAKNESSYQSWKGVEKSDCAKAGISR